MADKKALITGITGQDGSYLADFLLDRGYEVHGIIRRSSSFNRQRLEHLYIDPRESGAKLFLHYGDLSDAEALSHIIYNIRPDEVYNLGAQSHVRVSFDMPEYTTNVTALGVTRLLEIVRRSNHNVRIYQASSSEMFGSATPPQGEETPFCPRSPYACSKLYAYWMVKNYREGYKLFASNGILFNHESPRRGETFVTRKITYSIARLLTKKDRHLYLGNLESKRDWGYAPEYVEAMWKMLQQESADDFVIGTGESHSVQEFLDQAFAYADLDVGEYVKIDPSYFRPTEVEVLIADTKKSEKKLGWKPKIKFNELVKIMIDADMRAAGLEPLGDGDEILQKKFPHRYWTSD
ncbi:GDP-mannose 4,6-dehydratase [Methanoregula boonei 6A8]|jgi:GDPmannose 4,6-dehydratase|uniref:GDP-mannose 4,6-dehydratase n=1 Tax=Methanoregula boonei (strain DSM 21154 / JCM 14090 / 6A8) TaxID=456442 RepID=A7I967_METB6|nr:GDP-mannose 4,6-dehydratase [Methanoregula boonei]ABS56278.1 GDP-mannose 4,6-dehydratase [Methanoregula boonei 6A8]